MIKITQQNYTEGNLRVIVTNHFGRHNINQFGGKTNPTVFFFEKLKFTSNKIRFKYFFLIINFM